MHYRSGSRRSTDDFLYNLPPSTLRTAITNEDMRDGISTIPRFHGCTHYAAVLIDNNEFPTESNQPDFIHFFNSIYPLSLFNLSPLTTPPRSTTQSRRSIPISPHTDTKHEIRGNSVSTIEDKHTIHPPHPWNLLNGALRTG